MNKNNEEILKELERMELSIKQIKEFIGTSSNIKIIKTTEEFEDAFNKTARFLSSSDNPNTIKSTKHRLLKKGSSPSVGEAYKIQEEFGIPIYAWKDINWFKKTLLPK